MSAAADLTVDILSFWHPGSGSGAGMAHDALAHRDPLGLPVLPGRHIKGLLRDALESAEAWGWDNHDGLAVQLFGGRSRDDEVPTAGTLRVSDAALHTATAQWLAGPEGRALIPGLFRYLHATAIEASGVASDKSLRAIEVVVPLRLHARLEPVPGAQPPGQWPQRIAEVLPLVRAVGALRNRGLGRARCTLEEVAA